MLISKFNRIIKNRLLWTIFAVIISISFVASFTDMGGCTFSSPSAANKAYGSAVQPNAFNLARYFEMGFRRSSDLTPEIEKMLNRKAWERIALLGLAEQMKITSSDSEIEDAIRTDPAFSENGVFNAEKLHKIVQNQLGMNMKNFREYFRQELTLKKIWMAMSAGSLTSPYEMNNKISSLSDQFTVEYTEVKRSSMTNKIAASKQDAMSFFNDNAERFKVPEKVVVNYISIAASNYLNMAQPSEETIKEYYENNKETEFTVTDTNESETVKTYESVKKDIASKIQRESAYDAAKNIALEFVVDLQEDKYGKSLTIPEALKKHNLSTQKSKPFSMRQNPDWSDAGEELVNAAFLMDFAQTNSACSDVIEGKSNVYVLMPVEKKEAYLPSFEEIESVITPFATTNLMNKAFVSYAADIRQDLAKRMTDGKLSFKAAAKNAGLTTHTTEPFTVYGGFTNENEYADQIIGAVVNLDKGEISEPALTKNSAIFCHVLDRVPASPMDTEMLRPEVAAAIEKYRSAVVINDWRKKILLESGLKGAQDIVTGVSASEEPDEQN